MFPETEEEFLEALRGDDPTLAATAEAMVNLYEKKIYPSVDGIRNVIRLLGANNDKIRRLKAEDLVDDSAVRKLEKEGRF